MSAGIRHAVQVTIPADAWEPTGDYLEKADGTPDNTARLTATLIINGTCHHLEAFAFAEPGDEQFQEDEQHLKDENADHALGLLVGDGGFPVCATEINGRAYAILCSPFGD